MAQGMAQGMAEGHAKGIAEGRAEGVNEGKILVAKNLLKMGLTAEQVAEAAQLSINQINQIINSAADNNTEEG